MNSKINKLNSAQQQAITHTTGPLLIVAGAGTGKTTVITERIAHLINKQAVHSNEILALTFTDKAAGEMEERVDQLLPLGYSDLWIMTFHSFCERILKQHGLDIGLPNDFKLLNATEQWLLVRQNLDKFDLNYYHPLGNPTKFIHALLNHFSRAKDETIWPADYLAYAEKLKINSDSMEATGGEDTLSEVKRLVEIANAYHVYQNLLLENESLDFGDLINYCLQLFKTRPHLLKKYQNQFKYILVDEFQDTNWAQYELIKLLAGTQQNLTVVGDDDQSIYKFRGASVSNILQFKDDFKKSTEVYLNQNYRSSQNILDLSYNFIQLNNPERLEVKLSGKNSLTKKLTANTKETGIIEHLPAENENEEVHQVIEKIIALKNSDPEATWNDFAILVRANSQADSFLPVLKQAGITHTFVASKGLYSKDIILDIFAYLKLLDNYHESRALWRILNLPLIQIKPEDLMELTRFAYQKTISLYEVLDQVDTLSKLEIETKRKVKKIMSLVRTHTELSKKKGVKQVVLAFLNDFGYQNWLLKNNAVEEFNYINQLGDKIDDFQKSFSDNSIKNFIDLISLEIESGEQGNLDKNLTEGPEAVKIMTVHSAKGLEFKYVFIVGLVDKRFPSINRTDPIELPDELVKEIIPSGDIHLQEERRLFYVAMTRAKQGLYFTSASNYGGKSKKKPSRFLYETGILNKETEPARPAGGEDKKSTKNEEELKIKTVSKIHDKKQTKKFQHLLPKTFSYSQLKAFETCPYQYYLNFILKIPTPGKAVFSFGKTMHATLQQFFELIKISKSSNQADLFGADKKENKKLPPLKKLLELYEQNWIDDWYASKEEKTKYKKLGTDSLKNLHSELYENTLPQVLELEKSFNFKLNGYTIKGVIDRVNQLPNGKVEIVDYKTGSPKNEKTIEKDQLLLYQMAAAETFGWQVTKLTFYYLNNNSKVSFLGTDKEIARQKEKTLKLIKSILSTNFSALPATHSCKYCDFNDICSYKV